MESCSREEIVKTAKAKFSILETTEIISVMECMNWKVNVAVGVLEKLSDHKRKCQEYYSKKKSVAHKGSQEKRNKKKPESNGNENTAKVRRTRVRKTKTDDSGWTFVDQKNITPNNAGAVPKNPNKKKNNNKVTLIPFNQNANEQAKEFFNIYTIIKRKQDTLERINCFISAGMKLIVLMRGCPGSGKSTFARDILKKHGGFNFNNHIFSTDQCFVNASGQYVFNPDQLANAHEWLKKLVTLVMQDGQSPIFIDNTNTRMWEMKPYVILAMQFGYIVETLEPSTLWFNNAEMLVRKNIHSVPRSSITRMLERYEPNLSGSYLIRALQLNYVSGQTPPQHAKVPKAKPIPKGITKKSNKLDRPTNDSPSKKDIADVVSDFFAQAPVDIISGNDPHQEILNSHMNDLSGLDFSNYRMVTPVKVGLHNGTQKNTGLSELSENEIPSKTVSQPNDRINDNPNSIQENVKSFNKDKFSPLEDTNSDLLSEEDSSDTSEETDESSQVDPVENEAEMNSCILKDFNSYLEETLLKEGLKSHVANGENINIGDMETLEWDKCHKRWSDSPEIENKSSGQLPDSPKPQRTNLNYKQSDGSFDNKITSEHSEVNNLDGGLNQLYFMFPKLSKDILNTKFRRCNNHLDWTVSSLMDEDHEISEQFISLMEKKQLNDNNAFKGNTALCERQPVTYSDHSQIEKLEAKKEAANDSNGTSRSNISSRSDSISENKQPDISASNSENKQPDISASNSENKQPDISASVSENKQPDISASISENKQPDISASIFKTNIPSMTSEQIVSFNELDKSTNTNYMDFQTLNQIGYGLNISEAKVLVGKPQFIGATKSTNNDKIQPTLRLDRGTMTQEIESNSSRMLGKGLSQLCVMFPTHSKDVLEDLFERCQKDLDWAVGLLIDEGHEISEEFTSWIEPREKNTCEDDFVIVEGFGDLTQLSNSPQCTEAMPTSTKRSKKFVSTELCEDLKKQVENNFVINEDIYSHHIRKVRSARNRTASTSNDDIELQSVEEEVIESKDCIDLSSLEDELFAIDNKEVTVTMDKSFVHSLQNLFGGLVPVNMLDNQMEVSLPTGLARQLYSYVMDAVIQKIGHQDTSIEEMIDMELALSLSQEEKLSGARNNIPDLREIMDNELAMNLQTKEMEKEKGAKGDNDKTVAFKLSQQLLIERFPSMDAKSLSNVLKSAGNSLDQTMTVLASAGHIPILSGEETKSESKEEKLSKAEALSKVQSYRNLAKQLFDLRLECFRKAKKAFNEGNKSVASYYSQMANWHMKQIDEANIMAVTTLLSGVGATSTTVDLHFMHVKEALLVLDMFLDAHIRDLIKTSTRKRCIYVITGRGSHSKGGFCKLLPAVQERLRRRGIRNETENPGMLRLIVTAKEPLVCLHLINKEL